MNLKMPTGLFDKLSSQLMLIHYLPRPVLKAVGPLLAPLHVMPEDGRSAARALMAPHVREASLEFLKMVAAWMIAARRAKKQGRKVILVPFNFPPELIHAFDSACPLTSEVLSTLGVSALPGQGEEYWNVAMGLGLPDHLCSSNTIELGSVLSGDDFKPDAIISSAPGGCDVNSKIHEFVAHYLNIPQFFLQKPTENSGRGRVWYGKYMKKLVSDLEGFLGERLEEDKLRAVMEKANRCTELYYELWDLQKAVPSPVPNLFSLFIYGCRFTMWGTDEAIRTMEAMVRVSKDRLARKAYPAEAEVARCVWAYTSYYFDFYGFFNWMEERGYSHLGDGLDLFFPKMVDTSSLDTMIEGIAEAAWNMPMTRQVGAESMSGSWSDDVVHAVKELNADCVIYCGHHSCKQTWSVAAILRSELTKRAGVPLLVLQGDSWIKRMTPMSVLQQEIEEFVTNVVSKKDGKKRKIRRRKKEEEAGQE
jgi:benzoyl-CoA reductase/2-hydroxyglutaryl-CoA dehydratase subunit BcrC/BadD/HgdB